MQNSTLTIFIILFVYSNTYGQTTQFTDISSNAGINYTGLSSGIAFGDYDNDGDEDMYVSISGDENRLYQNQGDGTFIDVAMQAGVDDGSNSICAVWGDVNNDGHLDLYVGNRLESNKLYFNNGDGTFSDRTAMAGVGNISKPRSVMMADIDNDGDVEIYVANLSAQNNMYLNNGDSTFTEAVFASNTADMLIAMGSLFFDYDNDGDQDLYLTHDNYQRYILYQNQGNGTFVDVSQTSGTDYSGMGMGVDFGDYNNDGYLDLYITNLGPNTLLKNNGDGTFTDVSIDVGVTDGAMGWATFFLDINNDALTDLYVVNDSWFSPAPNVMYQNMGNDTFHIVSQGSVIESLYSSLGGASADIDNDGRIDFAIAIRGGVGNQLFQNVNTPFRSWIKIKTEGIISNQAGIGTRIEVYSNGIQQMNEVAAGRGYCSANSLTQHFGLNDASMVDSVILRWSSGQVDVYYNVSVNEYFLAVEGQSLTSQNWVKNKNVIHPDVIDVAVFPNPFNDFTQMKFSIEKSEQVFLNIFDSQGRLVRQLVNDKLVAGEHLLTWNGTNQSGVQLAAGVYFYSFQTERQISSGQILLMGR